MSLVSFRAWGRGLALVGVLSGAVSPVAAAEPPATVDVMRYVRRDSYGEIKISPKGDHYAATVPLEDRTILVVIDRVTGKPTAKIEDDPDTVVSDFWWVNDHRVIAAMAKKYGRHDTPSPTGELVGVDADGKRAKWLTGPTDYTVAFMLDTLRDDPDNVLITVFPYGADVETSVERMNVYNGNRGPVSSAPVRNAEFVTDRNGDVRFARGGGKDNASQLYYREPGNGAWRKLSDESESGVVETPVGLSDDGKTAYLQVQRKQGPDAIVAMDTSTGAYTELLRDPVADPYRILYAHDGEAPVGALYLRDGVRTGFFDEKRPTARYYRQMEKAFPGATVVLTSATDDGRLLLFAVFDDRNPGDFYLYDTVAKQVDPVMSRRQWFDPERQPAMEEIVVEARDGTPLHGYLTRPRGADPAVPLPMVVMPHGGPFGVSDTGWFDDDTQLLAEAGYAVLRINYRGSGGHGRAFMHAGAREWGGKMQQDLTDATRWAIAHKVAIADRICLYGASYGGYAALMGVAREPDLYRCAAGYAGVYDLAKLHRDVASNGGGNLTWADQWIGPRDRLEAASPTKLADRIKVPVFLAAGGADRRAPIEHSERMEKALKAAGVPVETLYYPREGHGFYTEEHRREFYVRLLAFLSRSLGGATAQP